MKFRVSLIAVASALVVAACKKSDTQQSGAPAAGETAPRRNAAESLGFASEADYFSSSPAAAAPAGNAPSPARGASAAAPISRNLKSADGRSVEALLLSRTDTAVKIRRKADAAEFTIPLEKLSAADRKFIEGGAVPLEAAR